MVLTGPSPRFRSVSGVASGALRLPRPWWRRPFPALLPNLGGPFLTLQDHRIELAIIQQQGNPQELSPDFDRCVVPSPTRQAPHAPTGIPAQSASHPATRPHALVAAPPGNSRDLPPDFDPHVVMFSTQYAACAPTELSAQSAGHPAFGVLPTADGGNVVWAMR